MEIVPRQQKPVIINVLPHPPAYAAFANKPRPEVNWNTSRGEWVGIWGYDFPNQLGNEILRITDEFAFEVWQPDFRADQVFSHTFDNGLVHRLFPARWYHFPLSFGRRKDVDSLQMVQCFSEQYSTDSLVQLHNITGVLTYRFCELVESLNRPIMVTGHGATLPPDQQRRVLARHPLTKLSLLAEEKRFYRAASRIDYISDENRYQINRLNERLGRQIEFLVVGSDFDFWIPRPPGGELHPSISRHKRLGKKIFLAVVNLLPRKRIDLLISTFSALRQYENFLLVIVGHGDDSYGRHLKMLGADLIAGNKLLFMDYTQGEALRSVYWAADFYILFLAKGEGTSVAMEHAAATSVPIITTADNGIADLLEDQNCGLVFPTSDLESTAAGVKSVLDGKHVLPLDRTKAAELLSWPRVADRYLSVYRNLFRRTSH